MISKNAMYKVYIIIFKNGEYSTGVCLKNKYLSEIAASYKRDAENAELRTLFIGDHQSCKYVANRISLKEFGNPNFIRERKIV